MTPRHGTHLLDSIPEYVRVLLDLIPDMSYLVGAEVGVLRGRCASHLLHQRPGLILYLVDDWSIGGLVAEAPEQVREQALRNTSTYAHRARFVEGSCMVAFVSAIPDALDFAFLDAAHDRPSVEIDLDLWWPKIRAGGLLLGHDYDRSRPAHVPGPNWDVKGAVDHFAAVRGLRVRTFSASIWCLDQGCA